MSTDSFNRDAAEDRDRATEEEGYPGRSVARRPGSGNNDCTRIYHGETHKFTEEVSHDERVPSAGWRSVYYSMEVFQP